MSNWLIYIGISFVILSLLILLAIFYPTIKQELSYILYNSSGNINRNIVIVSQGSPTDAGSIDNPINVQKIVPEDKSFGIIIPKINANAPVVADVNAQDPDVYQVALTKGVAHASGTVYPGSNGNTFLFAHSSDNFYNANRYNSVFYLLHKLIKGDDIFISYNDDIYRYTMDSKKIVEADNVEYLKPNNDQDNNRLTLMTCWPPGTTLKRLVVEGELVEKVDMSNK